jgi:hypothetical protein
VVVVVVVGDVVVVVSAELAVDAPAPNITIATTTRGKRRMRETYFFTR